MQEFLYIASLALLIAIAYQDFKERMISVYLFVALCLCVVSLNLNHCGAKEYLFNTMSNVAFISLQGIILYIYFRFVRNVRDMTSIMGMGDIVFILLLSSFFSPYWFVLFYLSSLVMALAVSLLMRLPQNNKSIPLAGFMAVQMVPVLVLQYTKVYIFCKDITFVF